MTQITFKDIVDKTKLTDTERKPIEKVRLSDKKLDVEKEIELSKAEIELLKDLVNKLDKAEQVTQMNMDICQKIKNA